MWCLLRAAGGQQPVESVERLLGGRAGLPRDDREVAVEQVELRHVDVELLRRIATGELALGLAVDHLLAARLQFADRTELVEQHDLAPEHRHRLLLLQRTAEHEADEAELEVALAEV